MRLRQVRNKKQYEIITEIITLITPFAQLRPHYLKFLPCAYCFENGGACTATLLNARWFRMNPSHAKSEDGMQRGERRKIRISGRPGEGAVWGVSGATRRSIQLKSQQCSALRDLDAIKQRVICVYAHWPMKNAVCAPPQDRAGASNQPICTNFLI